MTAAAPAPPAPLRAADMPMRLRLVLGAILLICIGGGLIGCGPRERIL